MLFHRAIAIAGILFLSFVSASDLRQPDYERESLIYNQNLTDIFDGEIKFIDYEFGRFPVIEINDSKKTAILYLHGRGLSPNDNNLAYPIRTQLSDAYNTFSIQLPVLAKGAKYYDYLEIFYESDQRIKSSLEYIEKKHDNLIIIAHSCGVHMLMSYIDNYNLSSGIKLLVLISSGAVDKGQSMPNEYPYKKINIPILDIYGEYDFNLVIKEANDRYKNIKIISSLSEQYKIKSSSHYHEDGADRIIEIVKKWLSDK